MIVPGYENSTTNLVEDYPGSVSCLENVASSLLSIHGFSVTRLYDDEIHHLTAGLADDHPTSDNVVNELNDGAIK